jgi:membrane protein implicated in regulation of membrane protease activity
LLEIGQILNDLRLSAFICGSDLYMPTIAKYWLIQLPGTLCLGAVLYWASSAGLLPEPWPLVILVAWVGKDALLYRWLRDAYANTEARHGPRPGQVAIVRKALSPEGKVRLAGALWNARLDDDDATAEAGESVRVIETRGLLLIVSRDHSGAASSN